MRGRETAANDITVALHRYSSSLGVAAAEIGRHFAGFVKAEVRRPIRVEARDCKSSAVAVRCVTGDDNFPVALHSDTAAVVELAKVGRCFAGPVKGRIESSICVVPRYRKIIVAGRERVSHHQNLPVALQSYAIGTVGVASDFCRDLPTLAKACVECAIGVVSQHSELRAVFPNGIKRIAGDNDFSIALQCQSFTMAITVTDCGNDFASAVEACVQTPIRIVTHQRDLIGATDAGVSRHHNLSIGLNGKALAVVNANTGQGGPTDD